MSTDVVGVDPDTAGERFADFLKTAGVVTFWSLLAVWVLTLVATIVVVKKAGYSGWWGALAVLVPPFGFLFLLFTAVVKWPALKERDEAVEVANANGLTLPSHERRAIKEAERKRQIEEEARRRMEKAQAEREAADAARARFQAPPAASPAAAPAPADAAPTPSTEAADAPADAAPAKPPTRRAASKPSPAAEPSGEQPVGAPGA